MNNQFDRCYEIILQAADKCVDYFIENELPEGKEIDSFIEYNSYNLKTIMKMFYQIKINNNEELTNEIHAYSIKTTDDKTPSSASEINIQEDWD